MPTKSGLTRQEHEELGATLKQLKDEVLCIALLLEAAYAKQSPCIRLFYRAAQMVERLRSALDRQVFLDYCHWDTQEKVQFKGAGRIILANHNNREDNLNCTANLRMKGWGGCKPPQLIFSAGL
jgi:hypothetical protein